MGLIIGESGNISDVTTDKRLKTDTVIRMEIPSGKTELREYLDGQLGAAGNTDTDYVIPNGVTWHVDTFWAGSESMGYAVLTWDAAGTPEEVARICLDSSNFEMIVNKDFLGNGVKKLRIRRHNNVANRYFSARIMGCK
jgi:hypothetical protein